MNGNGRIKSEKLIEHEYKEEYARSPDSKMAEWDEVSHVKQMWVSFRVGKKNPMSEKWK